jgi:hypothetical protein
MPDQFCSGAGPKQKQLAVDEQGAVKLATFGNNRSLERPVTLSFGET